MENQSRNFDAPSRKPVVSIEWERILLADETADRPDERDDAYWPSSDPDDAGYVSSDPEVVKAAMA